MGHGVPAHPHNHEPRSQQVAAGWDLYTSTYCMTVMINVMAPRPPNESLPPCTNSVLDLTAALAAGDVDKTRMSQSDPGNPLRCDGPAVPRT